jgi:prevent-host-death family protein
MADIDLERGIRPISEFTQNAADFIKEIKERKDPIVLTQRGKSVAVLMNVSDYQGQRSKMNRLEDEVEEYRAKEES